MGTHTHHPERALAQFGWVLRHPGFHQATGESLVGRWTEDEALAVFPPSLWNT